MSLSQQDILDALDRIKTKDRSYYSPADYKKFLPYAIPNVPREADRNIFQNQMQSVVDQSSARLAATQIKAQNQRDFQQMLEAQRRLADARNNLHIANIPVTRSAIAGHRTSARGPVDHAYAANVGVGRNLGHYKWNGFGLTLNESVHNNFINFLNALRATGYKIHSIGTYSNRNIAGTGTKSLHAYGLAMDINPAQNPVSWNGRNITNLPRGVGQLAARYGLVWGGSWVHNKRDPMHFSVPYGGRE